MADAGAPPALGETTATPTPAPPPPPPTAAVDAAMDSSEESENQPNEYQKDGFLVGNDEAVEHGDQVRKTGKRGTVTTDVVLDEDDLALIEENTGVKLQRPQSSEQKRRLKRFKDTDDTGIEKLEKELFGDAADDEPGDGEEARADRDREKGEGRKGSDARAGGVEEEEAVEEEEEGQEEREQERERREQEQEDEEGLDDFIEYDKDQRPGQRSGAQTGGAPMSMSSRALKEANAIFGAFDEFMPSTGTGTGTSTGDALMTDIEPALLSERFHTPQDERLRSTALPERYELAVIEAGRTAPEEGELREEATWVYERAFVALMQPNDANCITKESRAVHIDRITQVLEFMRRDNLEVPFVARYRHDYWREGLREPDLWDVHEWDEKWLHMHRRKRHLENMFKQTQEGTIHAEDALSLLRSATSEEELTDMHDYYNLHVSSASSSTTASAPTLANAPPSQQQHKRPIKRDFYSVCRRAGLLNCAKYFGLSAQQLGENLYANLMSTEPKDHTESPHELAERFTCAGFQEADAVLRACRYIQAQEIASDPRVRQWLRPRYMAAALLSTVATPRGKKEIDAWHMHRHIKRLLNKPIGQLRDSTQFLQVVQAEALGLLTKRLHLSAVEDETYAKEMERLYLSDHFGKHSAAWNEQRRLIVREALNSHLYPLLERELVQTLTSDAKRLVGKYCAHRLDELLMQGPLRPTDGSSGGGRNTVGCVWGGTQASWLVAVDAHGVLIDSLKLPFIGARADAERGNRADYERKLDDVARVRAFVSEHEPHALLMAASHGADGGVESRRLWDELSNVVNELRAGSGAFRDLRVLWVEAEAAHVYKNCAAAVGEMPEEAPVVRMAVGLVRYTQDPLSLLAALHNDSHDVLALRLHPLQEMLSKEERVRQLERRFVKVVNAVGVDLTGALLHRHAAATLQFVAGLGPRKAAMLLALLAKSRLRSRERIKDLVSSTVFLNCAGFVYFPMPAQDSEQDSDTPHEPLDATRVHPSDYAFARKMAADALDSTEVDEVALVLQVMREPHHLDSLASDALELAASEWERRGKEKKLSILHDIKAELSAPYKDPRGAYRTLTEEALFYALTGESAESLRVGQLLTVQVQAIRGDKVVCVLDSGLTGYIAKANLSDAAHGSFARIDEKVAVGMIVATRLLSVDKATYSVELTARTSELAAHDRWEQAHLAALWERERYLMPDSPDSAASSLLSNANQDPSSGALGNRNAKVAVLMRNVTHPYFKNVAAREADELLKAKPEGEFLIRPSSSSAEHLTLCWRWHDRVVHFDVQELEKPKRFELGKKLRLGQEIYDDLNELIARYVEPMSQQAREVADFRYFRRATVEEVEREMRDTKGKDTARIPYLVSPSQSHSGRYLLSYLPGARPKHELFTLTPRGLRFRSQLFPSIDALVKHLKTSFARTK